MLSLIKVVNAETATVFFYEEQEIGVAPGIVRYVVTDQYLRIDNGHADDDFILFDIKEKTIFNVNRIDRTILMIKKHAWDTPEFKFKKNITRKKLDDAPKIEGKSIIDYAVDADDKLCARYQLLPDVFKKERDVFLEYQYVLSGQQVKMLSNTPEEYQTPCFMLDQIYNDGQYLSIGLPVQEWHERGYIKLLKDYGQKEINETIFILPKDFEKYSIN